MGSTITTNRTAAAFKSPGGPTIWCLFEKTYEQNVHPHNPRWSCIYIGEIDGALKNIFAYASNCEGGMLRDRRGGILPENYIKRWLAEMAAPVNMPDVSITLRKEDHLHATIPSGRWNDVKERLSQIDRQDIVAGVEAGQAMSVSLHKDSELVCAIYGVVAPWRVMKAMPSGWAPEKESVRDEKLGYSPRTVPMRHVEVPRMRRIDAENTLVEKDGVWRNEGWAYRIVGSYVEKLWEEELRAPGSYPRLIREYRQAVMNAPVVLPGAEAVVDLRGCTQAERERSLEIAQKLGGQITETEAVIPWTEQNGDKMAYLPAATIWRVPDERVIEHSSEQEREYDEEEDESLECALSR